MINVSDQLLEESKENQDYYVTANVVLADGTKLKLEKEDFYLDGNGIVDSADSSDFPVGVAIEKTASISLVNDENQFSSYSFNRAVFEIYMNLELSDGKVESFKRGSFVVAKKPAIDDEITLTLLDGMCKTDRDYDTNITFPCTAGELLRDSCQSCGIVLGDAVFENDDFQVTKKPTGTTHRAVIGMIAALAGGNARLDENDMLRIVTYQKIDKDNFSGVELIGVDDVETDVDTIVVTGVKYTADKQDYIYGTDGYMINLKNNQLLSGNEQDGVNRIGEILTGFEILPFSASAVPMGYVTFGDAVKFEDYRGNTYYSYATDVDFTFADSTGFSCRAKSVENQDATYPSESRVLVEQAKREILENMSAYDIKLKQLNDMAANTLGFYSTQETLADGSVITYRHDKPTLAESKIIYKTGIDGFFLSVDGGETWKSGFDSNGDAVLNILYAIGIQGEWINTRGLTAKGNDGNITFRVNADTGGVEIDPEHFLLGDKSITDIVTTNLLRNANFPENTVNRYWWISNGTIESGKSDPFGGNEAIEIKNLPVTSSYSRMALQYAQPRKNLTSNRYYTSIWLKSSVVTTCRVRYDRKTLNENAARIITITPEWKEYTFVIDGTLDSLGLYIQYISNAVGSLFVYKPQITLGYSDKDIFNMLTNNGALKGIYMENGELYISFTYAKGGTLKLGGPNNGYGTFASYDNSGNLICQINNSVGLKNIKGNEWFQIKESVATAGYNSTVDGLLDLSAQYNDGGRHVVLQSLTGDLIFKIKNNFRIEGLKARTSGNPIMYNSSDYYAGYSSSSSIRYKVIGKTVKEADLKEAYRIKVIWAKYKDGYLDASDERCGKKMPMFLAEDIDRRFPLAVDHDEKGRAENWNYRIMIPLMFAMLKNDYSKITELQAENQELRDEIREIKNELTEIRKYIS